jgi:Tfp pilus assembly protein PilO
MTRIRQWSLGTAVLFMLILLGSWFLLVSPKKSEAADIQTQTQTQLSQNDALRAKLVQLQQQSTKLADQEARLAAIRLHLPASLALSSYIRSMSTAASSSNVSLDALSPSEPAAVIPPAAAGQTQANSAAGSLMVVKVDIKASGSYFDLEQFVSKLENQQRSMLVTGFTITPVTTATGAQQVTISLQGRIYYSPVDVAPSGTATTKTSTTTATS